MTVPEILGVEVRESHFGSKGTRISSLNVTYSVDLDVKTFRVVCGLNQKGFYITCSVRDVDHVIPVLKKHELLNSIKISLAADALKILVKDLGEASVKQAVDEAIVKLVVEE